LEPDIFINDTISEILENKKSNVDIINQTSGDMDIKLINKHFISIMYLNYNYAIRNDIKQKVNLA
jgi:hypothetical protein